MSIFDFFRKKENKKDLLNKTNKVIYKPISTQEQWQKYFFEEGKKDRIKNTEAKILVLGLGGGGSRVIDYMFKLCSNNILFGVINEYNLDFLDKNLPINYNLYYDGKEEGHAIPFYVSKQTTFNHLYDNKINQNWLKGFLNEPLDKLILVLGFGGHFSSLIANWIYGIANELNISIMIIGTLPFIFEGEKREKAKDQIKSIEKLGVNVVIIDNENLYRKYDDINIWNCFSYLDQEVSKKVLEICAM